MIERQVKCSLSSIERVIGSEAKEIVIWRVAVMHVNVGQKGRRLIIIL